MNIVTDSTGLVVMTSDNSTPTPPSGGTLYMLTDGQRAAFLSAALQPNNGVTFDGNTFTVLAFVPPIVIDFSNIDNQAKVIRAIGLMISNFTGKTPAQVKAAFLAAWNSLP